MPHLPKPTPPSYRPEKVRTTNEVNYKRYNSSRWRNYALANRGICKVCEAERHIKPADVMDHIVPETKGGSFWDSDNHMGMCESHHNKKRSLESRGFVVRTIGEHGDLKPYDRSEIIIKLLGSEGDKAVLELDNNWA
jgi:5-methylcytosine-specific restriction endonuclease McrA